MKKWKRKNKQRLLSLSLQQKELDWDKLLKRI